MIAVRRERDRFRRRVAVYRTRTELHAFGRAFAVSIRNSENAAIARGGRSEGTEPSSPQVCFPFAHLLLGLSSTLTRPLLLHSIQAPRSARALCTRAWLHVPLTPSSGGEQIRVVGSRSR
jgi:hypothetical protein